MFIVTGIIVAGCISTDQGNPAPDTPTPAEARAIAKEAYIYGFPMVDSYRIESSYFVNASDPNHKAAWNQIENTALVYTPADTTVQTPDSDTQYSMLGMDLRTEPLVLTVPPMDNGRYFSVQLFDAYTFNFAFCGCFVIPAMGLGRFAPIRSLFRNCLTESFTDQEALYPDCRDSGVFTGRLENVTGS